jgi:signal transduction histidine kinase
VNLRSLQPINHLRRAAVTGTALLVVVAASVALLLLLRNADDARRAQLVLAQIEKDVVALSALGNEIREKDAELSAGRAEQGKLMRSIDAGFDELGELGAAGVVEPAGPYSDFLIALDASFENVRSGYVDDAEVLDEEVAEPAVAAFSEELAAARRQLGAKAERAFLISKIGAALAFLIALAAIRILFWRMDRARAESAVALASSEQLALQNERLRELDQLKDEFVATVSHELRTPLTSIRGYLELVLEEEGSVADDHRRFLEIVDRNADRLLRLVGDLLFVAQVTAGRLNLEPGPVDLSTLASDCVHAARPFAADRGIELGLHAEALPPFEGDAARLAQLLDNLVSNAIKFTPAGGRVDVRVRASSDRALLEVSDTGMGIPADDLERLFERFFRTDAAKTQAIQGTGLGLSIARAIVDGHGGTIAVESTEGEGTTFRIELPLAASALSLAA